MMIKKKCIVLNFRCLRGFNNSILKLDKLELKKYFLQTLIVFLNFSNEYSLLVLVAL